MKYKNKSVSMQSLRFKNNLAAIDAALRSINMNSEHDCHTMQECTQKIIDCSDKLSAADAVKMVEGLAQMLSIASARINEVSILTNLVTNKKYVPEASFLQIVKDPALCTSSNLPEVFGYHLHNYKY